MECIDHNGKIYSSKSARANAYGLSVQCIDFRLKSGWSLEDALTSKPDPGQSNSLSCKDHLGNEYKSIRDMAKTWNINERILRDRLKKKWNLKDALTTPVNQEYSDNAKGKFCTDHLGNEFESFSKMCKYYNIPSKCVKDRISKLHWDLEASLTTPLITERGISCKDSKNKSYSSIKKMATANNIPYTVLWRRLKNREPIEKALCKNEREHSYSKEEDSFLKECYSIYDNLNDIVTDFNDKFNTNLSYDAITIHCRKLNLKKHAVRKIGEEVILPIKPYKYKQQEIYVKISDTPVYNRTFPCYRPKAEIIYEEHHGKIPPKHKIIFLDGNIHNLDINNLYCVPSNYMLLLRHYYGYTTNHHINKNATLMSIASIKLERSYKNAKEILKIKKGEQNG